MSFSFSKPSPDDAMTVVGVRPPMSRGKAARRWLAKWSRWLHIYLSMFAFATILFFSVTGLTLNHPEWFFQESIVQLTGAMPVEWLQVDAPAPDNWDQYDYSHRIDKLKVAEHLRAMHQLRGQVTDFLAFEEECELTFEGPGYAATARVSRGDGRYTVDVASNDVVTVLNDLHKGRHSGEAWSWVIDISAVLGALVSLTGFVLIFFLKLRLRTGLLTAFVGGAVLVVMYQIARM